MGDHLSLWWCRRDLRLEDNPALYAAAQRGPVVPVFVWNPEEEGRWTPGEASNWWLHHSLASLDASLRQLGSQLVIRAGDSLETLRALVEETGADAVFWNRLYEPDVIERDQRIKAALHEDGLDASSFNGALCVDPPKFFNRQGDPWKVFTPFFKAAVRDIPLPNLLSVPQPLNAPEQFPASDALDSLELLPKINWDGGLRETWMPGEEGAWSRLEEFIDERLEPYKRERDLPNVEGTSRLSPHLHFGEISPRRAIVHARQARWGESSGADHFVSEVYWREFGHYLLYHFPETTVAPLRPEFEGFPWREDEEALRRWQQGRTGYPLVDAGMRQLWETGWMHNRVRMVAASFLVKHLLIPWQRGAEWFWNTLVDADLASNTLGWQWTAGCGADAAPYFRIFNPIIQGKKFDPEGEYIARYVPELAKLPTPYRHEPWNATEVELAQAGVTLGETYPRPMVDHVEARQNALNAYEVIKKTSAA